MNINRQYIVLALLVAPLIAAPSIATASGYISVNVGIGGGGVGFGATDWAIYGAAWEDAGWGMSYDSALAGYGEWVVVDGIGRVWRPWVAATWRPYTYGRWVWTNVGWTWIAYEPWGYLPHHYGNWAMTTFGWVWVPGWTYRPATVSWMSCGPYVGWYPTPPSGWVHANRSYDHGWKRGYHSGYDNGYRDGWRDARYATWVPWGHLGDDDLSRRAVDYHNVSRNPNAASTRIIAAPDRGEVVRRGATVPATTLEQRTVTAGERQITVARPKGFTEDVRSHGEDTARRALSPRVSRPAQEQSRPQPNASGRTTGEPTARQPSGTRLGSSDNGANRSSDRRARPNPGLASGPSPTTTRGPLARPAAMREQGDGVGNRPINRQAVSRGQQPAPAVLADGPAHKAGSETARRPDDNRRGDRSAVQTPPSGSRSGIIDPRSVQSPRQPQQPVSRTREGSDKPGRSTAGTGSATIPGGAVIHPVPPTADPKLSRQQAERSRDDQSRRRSGSTAKPK